LLANSDYDETFQNRLSRVLISKSSSSIETSNNCTVVSSLSQIEAWVASAQSLMVDLIWCKAVCRGNEQIRRALSRLKLVSPFDIIAFRRSNPSNTAELLLAKMQKVDIHLDNATPIFVTLQKNSSDSKSNIAIGQESKIEVPNRFGKEFVAWVAH
jgi:hypothetical protein